MIFLPQLIAKAIGAEVLSVSPIIQKRYNAMTLKIYNILTLVLCQIKLDILLIIHNE